MTDQVTSIEQSKWLIEMGVPADKASTVWLAPMDTNEYHLTTKIGYCCPDERDIPAFTVADLLGIIKPLEIMKVELNPSLEKIGKEEWMFEFGEFTGEEICGFARNKSLIDLLVDRIEWIVSNGYELNLQ